MASGRAWRENWEGAKFFCSLSLRDRTEQEDSWRGLQSGLSELFSSDHCPFRYANEKGKRKADGMRSFRHIPNGIPGVETRLPILFSESVMKGRIDVSRFVPLTSTNHAKTRGLYPRKGTIAIGRDADITTCNPETRRVIRHVDLHDGSDDAPYEGLEVQGWPETVLLRGTAVIQKGTMTSKKQRTVVGETRETW